MNTLKAHFLVLVTWFFVTTAFAAGDLPLITETYRDSVIRITAIGHLYDGSTESQYGTGFFVSSDGFIVTASHVVPAEENYKSREFVGQLRLHDAASFPLALVAVDDEHGIAVLKAVNPGNYRAIPLASPPSVRQGGWVGVLRFQLDNDLLASSGEIESLTDRTGLWISSVAINPGSSGAPIVDEQGRVVGMGWGSLRFIVDRLNGVEREVPIEATNYVIPYEAASSAIRANLKIAQPQLEPDVLLGQLTRRFDYSWNIAEPLNDRLTQLSGKVMAEPGYRIVGASTTLPPPSSDFLSVGPAPQNAVEVSPDGSTAVFRLLADCPKCANTAESFQMIESPKLTAALTAEVHTTQIKLDPFPPTFDRAFDISEINDSHWLPVPHTVTYKKNYAAEPGFKIAHAEFKATSKNYASAVQTTVSDDGLAATVAFSLTSGPIYDRYRGWMFGTLVLKQVRRDGP